MAPMRNHDQQGQADAHWAQPLVDNLNAASREWVMTLPMTEQVAVLTTWLTNAGINSEWAAIQLTAIVNPKPKVVV